MRISPTDAQLDILEAKLNEAQANLKKQKRVLIWEILFIFSLPHARLQESREINILVGELQFMSDLFPVAVNSGFGYTPHFGDFFGSHSVPDHVADGDFGRCHRMVGKRQLTYERRGDFL